MYIECVKINKQNPSKEGCQTFKIMQHHILYEVGFKEKKKRRECVLHETLKMSLLFIIKFTNYCFRNILI